MYTLSSWRSHLGSVEVDILHQEPARNEGDPFTAYVAGEITQVSRMTDVHSNSWRSHIGSVTVDLLQQEPARTVGDPLRAYVSGEVAQVLRMTDVRPRSWRSHLGSVEVVLWTRNPEEPWGPISSLCFWRSRPGIEDYRCTP